MNRRQPADERHSAAIYGCTQSEFRALQDCHLTQNGKKLFVHGDSEVPITGSEWETRQLTLQPDEQLLFLPVKNRMWSCR